MKKKRFGLFKKLLLTGVLLCLAGALSVLVINAVVTSTADDYMVTNFNQLPQVDAIIVLGAYVTPSGSPSLMLKDRLDAGLEVYQAGISNRIVVTGDHGTKEYDEVNGMREYLQSQGIERDNIFMDHAGFNTYDSMYRARDVFLIKKAVIVTQEYHLYRAVYIARSLGIEAWGVSADKRDYVGQSYYDIREVAARVKDFFQISLFRTKPKFLGEPLPVWDNGSITDDGKS